RGGVLRHARRDHLRADLHAAVLCLDSRPGRTPRGARGRTRRRACAAGAGEPLMKTFIHNTVQETPARHSCEGRTKASHASVEQPKAGPAGASAASHRTARTSERASAIPAYAGMTAKNAETAIADNEISPNRHSCEGRNRTVARTSKRASAIPAFAGMTTKNAETTIVDNEISPNRHSCEGRNRTVARTSKRASAIPAFAGMTAKSTGMTTRILRASLLAAALALAGCASVGPNYHAAKIAAPQLQGLDAAQENNAQFQAAWWKQFNDPTLDALIQRAAANNLDLRIAVAR